MIRETTRKLSATRTGAARFWADGKYLLRAGFLPGMFLALTAAHGQIVITPSEAPTKNRVSAKDDGAKPVIDIADEEIQRLFGPGAAVVVRIEEGRICISEAALAKRIAERKRDGTMGSAFTGGGMADVAGERAGLTPVFGIEWAEAYANLAQERHPAMTMYHMSVHEAVYADLPSVEHFFLGIPCETFSAARRVEIGTGGKGKRDASKVQTTHPLGDMTLWAFALIIKVNPATVTIENVENFAKSEMAAALKTGLERLGYAVTLEVINANEHGGLTKRRRAVMIAQTPDADGTVPAPLPLAQPNTTPVAAYLDAEVSNEQWFDAESKPWVFNHAAKQAAKGNGFGYQVVDPTATVMPIIKKGYVKGQGDSPVLAHPTKPDTIRWFTISEIARFHGLPDGYVDGVAKKIAGEVIGQGIDIPSFTRIIAQATGRGDERRVLATRPAAPGETTEDMAMDDARTDGLTTLTMPSAPALARAPQFAAVGGSVQGCLF